MSLPALALAAALAAPDAAAPEIFAPGVISAAVTGTAPTFTPDGKTVFYQRSGGGRHEIVEAHRTDTGWSAATALPFDARWSALEPALSPDGSYLIFASNRPPQGGDRPLDGLWNDKAWPGRGGSLWRAERTATGWSQPRPLPASVNHGSSVFEPALTADGTLYFMRPRDHGKFQLFRARARDVGYDEAEPLPFARDGVSDVDPAVAPDESYLIFASGRGGPGRLDLYVAFRTAKGWSEPAAFPDEINAGGSITEPHISPDQQTLYFSRNMVIWSTPLQPILARLRPGA
jgi:hypothetical protein